MDNQEIKDKRSAVRKAMMKKAKEKIEEKMAGREIHIIKAINLLGDLDSVLNLLKENASEWKKRQPTGEAEQAYSELEKNSESVEAEKKKLAEFIEKEMVQEFPNFSVLATPLIGARLLAKAGSKERLCFFPASTIQVLGAEKALFSHMKRKANCPKHGYLFNHPLLQQLPRFKRGKAARLLAGKLSIALKIDYYKGEDTSKEIMNELEEKIAKIATEKATPQQEQKEKNYEQINADRRKEEFERKDKEIESGRKNFVERKPYFEKQQDTQQERPYVPRENRGFARERSGSGFGGERTFRPRREGGFRGPQRRGDFGPRREVGYGGRREGGFKPRRTFDRESSFRTDEPKPYKPRFDDSEGERSFGGERTFRPRKSDGFRGPRREDGRGGRRTFGPRREFSPKRDTAFRGPRREGSYGGRREGGFGPRKGSGFRGPKRGGAYGIKRNYGPKLELSKYPRSEGGYSRPKTDYKTRK